MNEVFSVRRKEKRRKTEILKRPPLENQETLSTKSERQINQKLKVRKNVKSKFDTVEEENIKEMGSMKSLPKSKIGEKNGDLNSTINNYRSKSKLERKLEKEKKAKTGFIIICILITILILANAGSIVFFYLKPNKIECGSGFYRPEDDGSNKICVKCSTKNCDKCLGDSLTDFCFSCKSGFTPEYENGIVKSCNYNNDNDETSDDDCLEFDQNGLCKKCPEGKYLCFYNENKQLCETCPIEHCTSCYGSSTSVICMDCEKGYYISYNSTNSTCNKCSEHCEMCIGDETFSHCLSCEETYNLNNGKCST